MSGLFMLEKHAKTGATQIDIMVRRSVMATLPSLERGSRVLLPYVAGPDLEGDAAWRT